MPLRSAIGGKGMAAETQAPWGRPVGNRPSPDPVALKVVTAVLVAPILLLLVLHVRSSWSDISGSLGELLAWTAALALLNVLEIPSWNGLALTPDIPLGVALSLLFPPLTAGLAALVGSLDREELMGRKSLVRAVFNRGNQAVGITLASLAAHMLTSDPS